MGDVVSDGHRRKRRREGGLSETLREARNWRELRQSPYGLRPLATISAAVFFRRFARTGLGLAAPEIIRDLDATLSGYISFTGLVEFLLIFAVLGVAYYCDRRSRVPLFSIGLIIGGAISALQAQSGSLLTFGLSATGATVAFALSATPRSSLLPDFYPPTLRGKAFAVLGLVSIFAATFLLLPAGELLERISWRGFYRIQAVFCIVIGIYSLIRLREPIRGYFERRELGADDEVARQEDEPPSFGEAWRTIWGIRTLRRVFIANMFTAMGDIVLDVLAAIYLFSEYDLTIRERSYFFFGVGFFAFAGIYLGGGVVDALLRRRPSQVLTVYGLATILSAVGLLFLPFAPPLGVLFVAFAITGFGAAMVGPALGVLYANILPSNVRTLGGAVSDLALVPSTVLMLPLVGIIANEYGIRSALFVPFPFLVIGALIFMSAGGFFEFDMRSAFASTLAREEWRRAKREGRGKLLVCRDVDVEYDGVQVLFGVDFDVDEGEIIALLGTNGAGKSTLLRAISGSQAASSGGIVFDGREVTYMPPHETAARGIIHMPGGRGVFPDLSVRENLLLGNWLTEDPAEVRSRLEEVLELFPVLAERADVSASTLSGGEQQMLSLAQAFLAKPRLLMIDELSLGLSPAVVGQLLEAVKTIHARGVTIIVVEQSVNVALNLAERAIFMEKGEVKFVGRTAELLRRPDILRAVYVKGTGSITDGAPAATLRSARERRALAVGQAPTILEVNGIVKRFGGVVALDGVGLDVRQGEVLGIIGPNGSGKTTLFDVISGFQRADEGTVTFEGVDITDLGPDERARRKLIRRFQDARLFPSLTVFEALLVSLEQRLEVRSSLMSAVQLPNARRAERRVRGRAERLIELLDLGAYRDKFVKELSTGLRRIVDLACVLANEPRLLLLDEPSSGIAQAEAEGLGPLLRRIQFETGCSIMIIEHDMPLISSVADELVALELGSVVIRGEPSDVLNNERVIESYLGGSERAIRRSGSLA